MRKRDFKRTARYQRRIYNKKCKLTRHHNRAKSLGGDMSDWNIYKLTPEHHQAFHKLFGNRTFDEAAKVLLRMQEIHNHGGG